MLGYLECPDTDLVAVAGFEDQVAARLTRELAIPASYRTLDEMLAAENLDVVSIATPTALHQPLTVAALDAGVHVLTEKPMAQSAAAAATMAAAARRNDRVLEVCYNHRRRGVVQALRRSIEGGLIGEPYYAKAGWLRKQGIPGLGSWFTRKDSAGGGPFMDLGVHMLDLSLFLLGEPRVTTVSASTYAVFGPRGRGGGRVYTGDDLPLFEVEDLATAFLRLDSGGTLLLEASWAQWIPRDIVYAEVYGSAGGARLEWEVPDGGLTITTEMGGEPAVVHPTIPADGGHSKVVADFIGTVRSGDWAGAHGEADLHRMEVIDAAYASADAGHEVTL